jgi:hypothetical protein
LRDLEVVARAFIEMAHRIVWCTAASVDSRGRPRSRVLHPIWEWGDRELVGWIATSPTRTKRAHIDASPYLSLNYWHQSHDTCVAECRVGWCFDTKTRERVWETFKAAPAPVGYDPAMIPAWESPASPSFAVLRLEPWRLRVFPGTVLLAQRGEVLVWEEADGNPRGEDRARREGAR